MKRFKTRKLFLLIPKIIRRIFGRHRETFEEEVVFKYEKEMSREKRAQLYSRFIYPILSPFLFVLRILLYPIAKAFGALREKSIRRAITSSFDPDEKIVRIQKSTRTTFRLMIPAHNWMRSRFKWYYNWHINPFANHVHWASLAVSVITLAGFMTYTFFPFSHARAANYSNTWTSTSDFDAGTKSNVDSASNQVKLAQTTTSITENFSTTTYKDTTNTTASWSANSLTLPGDPVNGTPTDLEDKWKMAIGTSEDINAFTYDSTNQKIYMGGSSGSFAVYNPATQVTTDLTDKISSDWGNNAINGLTFDSVNGYVYLGGNADKFGAFLGGSNPSAGTWTNLYSTISTDFFGGFVISITFDSTNGYVYISGNGDFGAFLGGSNPSAGTWVNLKDKISADWSTGQTKSMTFDSTNGYIYLGGASARFGAFLGGNDPANGTWTYLNSKISGDWSTNTVYSMTFDPTNGFVYLGSNSGRFGAFLGGSNPSGGTWTYLTSKISSNWGSSTVASLGYDATNNYVYLVGSSAKFGAFKGDANPGSGTFTYLNSKISADWGSNNATAVVIDSTNHIAYIGGVDGKFGSLSGGNNPTNGTWNHLTSRVVMSYGYQINASAYDSTNGYLYLAGASGKFGAYNTSSSTMIDLTSEISSNWSTSAINALAFDSVNNYIYLAGDSGKFGAYNGGSDPSNGAWAYLNSKITSDWSTSSINSLTFDSTNSYIYLGGPNANFGAFLGGSDPANGTWTYLNSKISGDWSTNIVSALTFDSTNGYVYLGSDGGRFGAFIGGSNPSGGTWAYLTAKISANWSNYYIYSLSFDSINGYVYLAGASGKFGAFLGGSDPANGTWTYLIAKISSNWGSTAVSSMVFAGGKIYLGGGDASSVKFGVFNGGSTPSGGTWNYLATKINNFWNASRVVKTLVYVPSLANIYLGGDYGEFASYQVGYTSDKNGVSLAVDGTTQPVLKATLTATASTPTNTAITYYLSNDGGSSWNTVTSGSEYTFSASGTDLRWKANLTTTDLTVTPEITAIVVSYKYYTASSGSINLKFNGGQYNSNQAVAWDQLSWTYTKPTNTNLTFKIRGAGTEGGLTSATWSSNIAATSTPQDLRTVTIGATTGLSDSQWVEIEADFSTSDSLNTATLSDLTLSYVINAAPEVQTVSATQATDGTKVVNISYQARDADTSTNPTPSYRGYVSASFQYSINSGSSWNAATMTSGSGLVSIDSTNFTTKSAVWNAGADLANSYYSGTVMIRVTVDDSELAHSSASADSAAFTIDTKNPVPVAIGSDTGIQINSSATWTNSGSVNLALSVTDDSSKQMQVRNDNSFTSTYETYATTKTAWSLSSSDGNKTVYVRFKDSFGNTADASATILLDTTAPGVPGGVKIYDTSERSLSRYSLTIIWNTVATVDDFNNYVIERSINGSSYTQITTTTSTVYTDLDLSNSNTYSYRIKSTDDHSNSSAASDVATLRPTASDVTAPIITGGLPAVSASDVTATISWSTDEPADSFVEFGTTAEYGNIQGKDELAVDHSVTLIGLTASTTYHFRVRSKDSADNLLTGDDVTFATTISSEASTAISITGATAQKPGADPEEVSIIWTTDKYATSQVLYGSASDNLDNATTEDTTLNKTHYVKITKLKPNTQYYYRARSVDTYGNEVLGEIKYFVTTQTDSQTPTISNLEVSDITLNSAKLAGKQQLLQHRLLSTGLISVMATELKMFLLVRQQNMLFD